MSKKKSPRTPSFRHHKATGQGYVELVGKRIYLGRYDRAETREKYHRLLAEWIANGRQLAADPDEITVSELLARFWVHAQTHYRNINGEPTSELDSFKWAMHRVRELYGKTSAARFSPRSLKAVRQSMIDAGWCRTNINRMTGRVKHIFRWGVENELVAPSVYHGLQAVTGLKRGRTDARESEPVRVVLDEHIEAVREHVSRQVWALIRLQLLTAARAGELVVVRAVDIDTRGKVWTYKPPTHKTAHHGIDRKVFIGPEAQRVLAPFMANRAVDCYLFSPREAETERHSAAPTHRRKSQKPNAKKTDRVVGERYTTASYRRAIERACRAAKVPVWTPHRLRHNAATAIRREHGVEAAQLLLGHARVGTTQIYAEVNTAKAEAIALKVG